MIADPVCSIFIAVLIALSVGSLVADSVAKVMQLEGVQAVQETHFWALCSNYYCGGLKLEVAATADHKYIVSHTQNIFRGLNVTQLYVHLDYIEPGQQGYSNGYQAVSPGQNLLLQGGYQQGYLGQGYQGYQQPAAHGHAHDDHSGHGHSHDSHGHSHD